MTEFPRFAARQAAGPESPARRLRALLAGPELIICPGVVDSLYARLAERAGFDVIYATGAGIANTHFGVPDLGLLTMSELLAVNQRIVRAVSVPVIADIDTGYGGALNVYRTVQEFDAAGVAAVQLEDQVNPKRCGHFTEKAVVPLDEMLERLVAADEARADSDLVIIARTDALAVHGLAEALRRAAAAVEAGADAVFIEAPETVEQMRTIPRELDAPVVLNVVEGGLTPLVQPAEIAEMGYRIALYANAVMRTAVAAAVRGLASLRATGGPHELLDEMLTWDQRQGFVHLDHWLEVGDAIASRAAQSARQEP